MIVSIHQPHFLPWTGYLNKVLHSQAFVWLNTVQYRKNYFQNRTRIKDARDQLLWLTLPVHARSDSLICDVRIADLRWRERIHKTVEYCYKRAPFFAVCWPPMAAALADTEDRLDDINFRSFLALLEILRVKSPRVVRATELDASTTDPTLRLLEICRALGGTQYLSGRGGKNYLRLEEFDRAGIEVIFQDFDSEILTYPQTGKTFSPGLSLIDCLFNVGPQKTVDLVMGAWNPKTYGCAAH